MKQRGLEIAESPGRGRMVTRVLQGIQVRASPQVLSLPSILLYGRSWLAFFDTIGVCFHPSSGPYPLPP
jgi:hypothetical protein